MGAECQKVKGSQQRENLRRQSISTKTRISKENIPPTNILEENVDDDIVHEQIDENGPSEKYSLQFLKNEITASSNKMQSPTFTSNSLNERKFEKQVGSFKRISLDLQQVQKKQSNSQPIPHFKSIKIVNNFHQIRNESSESYYEIKQKIGEGTFGSVFRAICRSTGELRAIKIVKKRIMSEEQKNTFKNQIQFLKKLDHVNIIKLYDLFYNQNNYEVVTEFCKGGSLLKFIRKSKFSSEYEISNIARQILSALTYLHDQKIVHKDLKLENIVLVDNVEAKKKELKILDFGFTTDAPKFVKNEGRVEGTVSYMPPEGFQGEYSTFSDIWSFGIIMCLLLTGKNPFKGKNFSITMNNIKKKKINFESEQWKQVSKQGKQFVSLMIKKKPEFRISARQALSHPFVGDLGLVDSGFHNKKLNHSKIMKNFQSFYRGSNFSALVKSYICTKKINQQERQELATLFEKIDKDYSGFVEKKQLISFYKTVKMDYDETEINRLFEKVDCNLSGKVDFNEFLMVMTNDNILSRQGSLSAAFDYLDIDRTGYIQKAELINSLGGFEQEEIASLMKNMDENNDEKISRDEFKNYMIREY